MRVFVFVINYIQLMPHSLHIGEQYTLTCCSGTTTQALNSLKYAKTDLFQGLLAAWLISSGSVCNLAQDKTVHPHSVLSSMQK